jgi:hypothetical protein
MLGFFANGQGVKEICTTQKTGATPTTFVISVMSTTQTASNTMSGVVAQVTAGIKGGDTSMAMPKGTVIAVVVVVVVVISVLAVVGVTLFRKYYK